jgi:YbgC/YbaW family acyl-CoA thioester hydrolase
MQSFKLTIREHHLDTYKHVNNATYLTLYETARWEWITEAGLGLEQVQASQIGPVLLELNLVFKRELTLREEITIETRFLQMKNPLVMELEQRMLKGCGSLASKLVLSVGIMDMQKRKLIAPPEEWVRAMDMIKVVTESEE